MMDHVVERLRQRGVGAKETHGETHRETHGETHGENHQPEHKANGSNGTYGPPEVQIEHAQALGYDVPPMPEQSAELVLVTPEIADEWLASDFVNRRISERHLGLLIKDMQDGRFFTTNQAIGQDVESLLGDGQHRITAIKVSGKPQWLWVIKGLTEAALLAIDRNKTRSVANYLQMMGYSHSIEAGSIAKLIAAAEEAWARRLKLSSVKGQAFTHSEIIEDILWERVLSEISQTEPDEMSDEDRKEAVRHLAEAARKFYEVSLGAPKIPKSAGGAFYYLARIYHGAEETEAFVEQAGLGLGVKQGKAAHALRRKVSLIQDKEETRRSTTAIHYLAYMIVAFNKFVADETVQRLDLPKNQLLPKIAPKK